MIFLTLIRAFVASTISPLRNGEATTEFGPESPEGHSQALSENNTHRHPHLTYPVGIAQSGRSVARNECRGLGFLALARRSHRHLIDEFHPFRPFMLCDIVAFQPRPSTVKINTCIGSCDDETASPLAQDRIRHGHDRTR